MTFLQISSRPESCCEFVNGDGLRIDHPCDAAVLPRQGALVWALMASLLPWLCGAWPWPLRILAGAVAGACTYAASKPLRQPCIGPVGRILRHGEGSWLLCTPGGVFAATLDQAQRLGPWGWWLQFQTGGRRVWCWLSAAAPDRVGYRRIARQLTARWT